jgi:hypothetical protein
MYFARNTTLFGRTRLRLAFLKITNGSSTALLIPSLTKKRTLFRGLHVRFGSMPERSIYTESFHHSLVGG